MKKFLSVIMAVAMIFAMTIPAFAATITINGEANRVYNGYKLLNLTTSLKPDNHPADCDDSNHIEGCYNYAYTVNSDYSAILKQDRLRNSVQMTKIRC